MQNRKLSPLPEAVAALKARIEHWRMTRPYRCPMAEDLWSESARLAREHGIWAISKALRLNYEALKSWTEELASGRAVGRPVEHAGSRTPRSLTAPKNDREPAVGGPARKPTFIRLDPLTAMSAPCSTVEVCSRDGTRMAIQIPVTIAVDVVALVAAFVRRR
jgi:hypothetical protein